MSLAGRMAWTVPGGPDDLMYKSTWLYMVPSGDPNILVGARSGVVLLARAAMGWLTPSGVTARNDGVAEANDRPELVVSM